MIEVKNLTKKYGDHVAVNHLNFTIESGKVYGFLGPNGAGKSTTMNMITGCLAMTEGQVLIDGHDIITEQAQAKKHIGYLPEIPPLYTDMTPREYLTFVARAKGVSREDLEAQVEGVMEDTDITSVADRLIRNLSKGYKQRVGIAMALLGDPEIIILDEPTVGLDPLQIIEIRDLIKELGKSHTVILSSHILAEVSEVCDHVMIIAHGNLVASDTLENIRSQYAGENVITCEAKGTQNEIRRVIEGLKKIESAEVSEIPESRLCRVRLTVEKDADVREQVFLAFAGAKIPLLSMIPTAMSLEDVFLKLTADDALPAASADASVPTPSGADGTPAPEEDPEEEYTPLFGSRKKGEDEE